MRQLNGMAESDLQTSVISQSSSVAGGARVRTRSNSFEYVYEYHFIEYEYEKLTEKHSIVAQSLAPWLPSSAGSVREVRYGIGTDALN